jgi:purine-binding chemotaxis protein CheW
MDILTFELDSNRYAFPAGQVVRVVQTVAISPLPGAPAIVEGVVNIRGAIAPVFDLRARLGLPPRQNDPSQTLVILRSGERQAAVRVDTTEELVSVPDDEISRLDGLADPGQRIFGTRHVAGIAATPDGTTVIFDLAAFLSPVEAGDLDAALAQSSG